MTMWRPLLLYCIFQEECSIKRENSDTSSCEKGGGGGRREFYQLCFSTPTKSQSHKEMQRGTKNPPDNSGAPFWLCVPSASSAHSAWDATDRSPSQILSLWQKSLYLPPQHTHTHLPNTILNEINSEREKNTLPQCIHSNLIPLLNSLEQIKFLKCVYTESLLERGMNKVKNNW